MVAVPAVVNHARDENSQVGKGGLPPLSWKGSPAEKQPLNFENLIGWEGRFTRSSWKGFHETFKLECYPFQLESLSQLE